MRTLIIRSLFSCGLLFAGGLVLSAQPYPNDPYNQQRDPYYRGDPYGRGNNDPRYRTPGYGDSGAGLFDRIQADLARAESSSYGSQKRIEHARKQVYDFQNRLTRRRFDRGKLDGAISAVQHVVDSGGIRGRDRAALQEDVARMREFRAAQGYGYNRERSYGPGYRY